MFKKFCSFFITFIFLFTSLPCYAFIDLDGQAEKDAISNFEPSKSYVFQGHVEINKGQEASTENLFTGELSNIKKGTEMKMSVSSVLSNGYTRYGDEFFAEITNDVITEEGIVIPAGTTAHGIVSAMGASKAMGRDAYITLDFDYLITPDGRRIPIQASMSTKKNAATSIAKSVLRDAGYTVAGGLVGSLAMLRLVGTETSIAAHGGTIAAGAGLGAIAGLSVAVTGKGKNLLLTPGDEISVKIQDGIELPVLNYEALKQKEKKHKGLNIKITNIGKEKDPFGQENIIAVSMLINNQSNKSFSSFDIALMNEAKNVYYPSPFGSSDFWFTRIMPGDRKAGCIAFSVANPRQKHWLIFYDKYTRKPLAKISLENAKREIQKNRPNKKRKKFIFI